MTAARSTDYRLPLWLRLVALAVEDAEADVLGTYTATYARGELRERLADGLDLNPSNVNRAIRHAIATGLLARGSSTCCLRLVPGSLTNVQADR